MKKHWSHWVGKIVIMFIVVGMVITLAVELELEDDNKSKPVSICCKLIRKDKESDHISFT